MKPAKRRTYNLYKKIIDINNVKKLIRMAPYEGKVSKR